MQNFGECGEFLTDQRYKKQILNVEVKSDACFQSRLNKKNCCLNSYFSSGCCSTTVNSLDDRKKQQHIWQWGIWKVFKQRLSCNWKIKFQRYLTRCRDNAEVRTFQLSNVFLSHNLSFRMSVVTRSQALDFLINPLFTKVHRKSSSCRINH